MVDGAFECAGGDVALSFKFMDEELAYLGAESVEV